MLVSSRQLHANLLVSMEAERDGHQPQRVFCAVGCMPVLGSLPALR